MGQSRIIQSSRHYYDDQVFEVLLARQRIVVSERSSCLPYAFVETHFRMKSMSAFSKDFLNKQWLDGCGKCNTMPMSLIFIDTPPEVFLQANTKGHNVHKCRSPLLFGGFSELFTCIP